MRRLRSWWRKVVLAARRPDSRDDEIKRLTARLAATRTDLDNALDRADRLRALLDDRTARHEAATAEVARLQRALACPGCQGWQGRAQRAEETARRTDAMLAELTAALVVAEAEVAQLRRVPLRLVGHELPSAGCGAELIRARIEIRRDDTDG